MKFYKTDMFKACVWTVIIITVVMYAIALSGCSSEYKGLMPADCFNYCNERGLEVRGYCVDCCQPALSECTPDRIEPAVCMCHAATGGEVFMAHIKRELEEVAKEREKTKKLLDEVSEPDCGPCGTLRYSTIGGHYHCDYDECDE